jgi:hypothetical protein
VIVLMLRRVLTRRCTVLMFLTERVRGEEQRYSEDRQTTHEYSRSWCNRRPGAAPRATRAYQIRREICAGGACDTPGGRAATCVEPCAPGSAVEESLGASAISSAWGTLAWIDALAAASSWHLCPGVIVGDGGDVPCWWHMPDACGARACCAAHAQSHSRDSVAGPVSVTLRSSAISRTRPLFHSSINRDHGTDRASYIVEANYGTGCRVRHAG